MGSALLAAYNCNADCYTVDRRVDRRVDRNEDRSVDQAVASQRSDSLSTTPLSRQIRAQCVCVCAECHSLTSRSACCATAPNCHSGYRDQVCNTNSAPFELAFSLSEHSAPRLQRPAWYSRSLPVLFVRQHLWPRRFSYTRSRTAAFAATNKHQQLVCVCY